MVLSAIAAAGGVGGENRHDAVGGSPGPLGGGYTGAPGNWAPASRPVRAPGGVYTGRGCDVAEGSSAGWWQVICCHGRGPGMARRSGSWPGLTGGSCRCIATGCWGPSPTLRTPCRRRCWPPGRASAGSVRNAGAVDVPLADGATGAGTASESGVSYHGEWPAQNVAITGICPEDTVGGAFEPIT